MSSRLAEKEAARRSRTAAETRARQRAARRARIRGMLGVLLAATVLVAAIALSSGQAARVNAATGARLVGAAATRSLFAGIPQHGAMLGRADAPIRLVEFADLQCPYCDAYALQALPTLVTNYVRTGELQMRFENLSFIGPDSVKAGRLAAAAGLQNRLWNFIDLLYLNQGQENTGYVTAPYVQRLLHAVPGLEVSAALRASAAPAAIASLTAANTLATQDGINATPTFLIGRAGAALRVYQPPSLTAAPFEAEIGRLLR